MKNSRSICLKNVVNLKQKQLAEKMIINKKER